MSRTRRDRTWPRPRTTRHAWLRDSKEEPPRQVLIVEWRRHSYIWRAYVVYVIAGEDGPAVVQRWVPADQLRPVRSDPNGAFGLH